MRHAANPMRHAANPDRVKRKEYGHTELEVHVSGRPDKNGSSRSSCSHNQVRELPVL